MSFKKTLHILAFLSALLAIILQYRGNTPLYVFFKPLTTIIILLIPIIYGNTSLKNYLRYTVLALVFCLAGDIFLLDNELFIWGLAAFLIAHIFFTLSFVSLGGFKLYLLPLILPASFALSYYYFLYQGLGGLAVPVLVYMVFIVLMSWQGMCLYIRQKEKSYLPIAVAVLLFMFSDSVIAWNKFNTPFQFSEVIVLATYWLSIALLANAATRINRQQ